MTKQILRNIGIVFSGSTVAQAILFVATIFLTRLYSPAAFGVFAIFLASTNILGLLITGRYETVIPLPSSPKEPIYLLWGVLAISSVFLLSGSILSPVIYYFFKDKLVLNPLSICFGAYFMGGMSLLHFLLIRWERYAMLSGIRIISAAGVSALQLSLYPIAPATGLVNGYLWGTGLVILLVVVRNLQKPVERPGFQQIRTTLKKYASIIKWSLPSGLLNTATNNIQPLLIGLAFGNKEAGLFFLAYKVMGTPITLISSSIAQVFFKEAVVTLQKGDKHLLLSHLKYVSGAMALLLALFFTALFFSASFLFSALFGERWAHSSVIVIWLIPYFLGKGIFQPVSFLAEALNKTKTEMQFSIVALLNMMAAITLGFYFNSLKVFVLIFSIGTGLAYLCLWLIFYFMVSSGNYERKA